LNPNLQFSNSQFPNFPISNCKPLPSFNFSDNSDLLRSLTIGGDPSDPFRSLRSLRSLRSVPIPLIRVISSTHTHCQYLSFLSLRMLIIGRTSSTRGALRPSPASCSSKTHHNILRPLASVPFPKHLGSSHFPTDINSSYSLFSLRLLVIVRTSSTRGARLGTRAGTCP